MTDLLKSCIFVSFNFAVQLASQSSDPLSSAQTTTTFLDALEQKTKFEFMVDVSQWLRAL